MDNTKKIKKKSLKNIAKGVAHIITSFNNVIVVITDQAGNVIVTKSAGALGFRGTKKSTPWAGQSTASAAVNIAKKDYGLKIVSVVLKGPGPAREAALRAIQAAGLNIISLEDRTPVPHNGCRPRRKRRV